MGDKTLNQANTATALELMFGDTLPNGLRQQILAQVPQNGYSKQQFIEAVTQLPFSRLIATEDKLYALLRLTGRDIPDFPPNWDALSAPDRIDPELGIFNLGVYYRGAATVHALRLQIGDEAFWQLLRGFLQRYRFGNASVEDWLGFVQTNAGQAAKDLQIRWLRDETAPDFPELGLKATDFALGADFK
jgi:hypothetical protein